MIGQHICSMDQIREGCKSTSGTAQCTGDYNVVINYAFAIFEKDLNAAKIAVKNFVDSKTNDAVSSINDLVSPTKIRLHLIDYELKSSEIFTRYKSLISSPVDDSWTLSAPLIDVYTRLLTKASSDWQWYIEGISRDLYSYNGSNAYVIDSNGQSKIDAAINRRQVDIDEFLSYVVGLLSPSISAVVDALNNSSATIGVLRLSDFKRRIDLAKDSYLSSIDSLINGQVIPDIDNKLLQPYGVVDNIPSKIDSYISGLSISLGYIDSSDFRSKLSDIRKGASTILSDDVALAFKLFGSSTDYWFSGEPNLFDRKLSEISKTFNDTVSAMTAYSDEYNTYATSMFTEASDSATSKIAHVNDIIALRTDSLRDKIQDARVLSSKKINDFSEDRPIIRLTGVFSIPSLNWSGSNKFGVQVVNVGKRAISLWFGWRFIDSNNKSYIYNQTPTSIPIINPGDTVMIESDIPFDQLFPAGSPGKLRARLIPTRGGS